MAVIINLVRGGDKNNDVTEIQKALISLGANIDSAELFTATAGTYGPTGDHALLHRFVFRRPSPAAFRCLGGKVIREEEYHGRQIPFDDKAV